MSDRNILSYDIEELENEIMNLGEQKYRATQIFSSIHKRNVLYFEDIKGIPKALKKMLEGKFIINNVRLIKITDSEKFTTKKFLFETTDKGKKNLIESVLISEKERNTVCISTQVGCNAGCEFCATGKMGFKKNLNAGEIVSQVYEVKRLTGAEPTNIVYMGMGEPFLNYENMFKSLRIITNENGLGIPSRRITVSTIGFKDKIRKFADDIVRKENSSVKNVKLALSLHSTDNGLREKIIPASVKNRLPEIYSELAYFYKTTGNKITYEYIFFEGLNDTDNDIKRLEKLSRMVPSNINIIPFHPIDFELNEPLNVFKNKKDIDKLHTDKRLSEFIEKLKSKKVVVNLRNSSGVDINAACGQLAVLNN